MKLSSKGIGEFLNRTKPPEAVLIYGPDAGLVRERMKLLAAKALPKDPDPLAFTELSEDEIKADPARLMDVCSAYSLLGGARVIALREITDKTAKVILEAATMLASDTTLLICAGELTPRSLLRAGFEQHPTFAALPCYKDEGIDLQNVIRSRLEGSGLRVGRETITYLAERLVGDRMMVNAELDKIALYKGQEKELTLDDAMQLVPQGREAELDQLSQALADLDAKQLDGVVQALLREGDPPIMLLRAAQRYFQRLYGLKVQMEAGAATAEAAIAALRPPVFFRQQDALKRHVRIWSLPKITRMLARLKQAELSGKSLPFTSSYAGVDMLQRLIVAMKEAA